MSRLPAPWPQCRLLSDDNKLLVPMHSCNYRHFSIGPTCELIDLQFLNSPAISDSEEDNDEKENLEKGVDEAEDVNGTKGYHDDICIYF